MRTETKGKVMAWAIGFLTLPIIIGLVILLTYVRKITADFWAGLFGF
jgi:hypothetical protein